MSRYAVKGLYQLSRPILDKTATISNHLPTVKGVYLHSQLRTFDWGSSPIRIDCPCLNKYRTDEYSFGAQQGGGTFPVKTAALPCILPPLVAVTFSGKGQWQWPLQKPKRIRVGIRMTWLSPISFVVSTTSSKWQGRLAEGTCAWAAGGAWVVGGTLTA